MLRISAETLMRQVAGFDHSRVGRTSATRARCVRLRAIRRRRVDHEAHERVAFARGVAYGMAGDMADPTHHLAQAGHDGLTWSRVGPAVLTFLGRHLRGA